MLTIRFKLYNKLYNNHTDNFMIATTNWGQNKLYNNKSSQLFFIIDFFVSRNEMKYNNER